MAKCGKVCSFPGAFSNLHSSSKAKRWHRSSRSLEGRESKAPKGWGRGSEPKIRWFKQAICILSGFVNILCLSARLTPPKSFDTAFQIPASLFFWTFFFWEGFSQRVCIFSAHMLRFFFFLFAIFVVCKNSSITSFLHIYKNLLFFFFCKKFLT